jgi:hypothetical protein
MCVVNCWSVGVRLRWGCDGECEGGNFVEQGDGVLLGMDKSSNRGRGVAA